jgi:hypothetical protein
MSQEPKKNKIGWFAVQEEKKLTAELTNSRSLHTTPKQENNQQYENEGKPEVLTREVHRDDNFLSTSSSNETQPLENDDNTKKNRQQEESSINDQYHSAEYIKSNTISDRNEDHSYSPKINSESVTLNYSYNPKKFFPKFSFPKITRGNRRLTYGLLGLFGLFVLAIFFSVLEYRVIDKRVARVLSSRGHGTVSAVIAGAPVVKAGQSIPFSSIKTRLIRRAYTFVEGVPQVAGEANCSDKSCAIFTREFHTVCYILLN